MITPTATLPATRHLRRSPGVIQRLRDRRFLRLADAVAEIFAKDPTTKVGAVLVGEHPNQVALGYNGLPPGLADLPERLNNREWKNKHTLHAETNAILNADFAGTTLYATRHPCLNCALTIAGTRTIRRVVAPEPSGEFAARWGESTREAAAVFDEAGITLDLMPLPGSATLAEQGNS